MLPMASPLLPVGHVVYSLWFPDLCWWRRSRDRYITEIQPWSLVIFVKPMTVNVLRCPGRSLSWELSCSEERVSSDTADRSMFNFLIWTAVRGQHVIFRLLFCLQENYHHIILCITHVREQWLFNIFFRLTHWKADNGSPCRLKLIVAPCTWASSVLAVSHLVVSCQHQSHSLKRDLSLNRKCSHLHCTDLVVNAFRTSLQYRAPRDPQDSIRSDSSQIR